MKRKYFDYTFEHDTKGVAQLYYTPKNMPQHRHKMTGIRFSKVEQSVEYAMAGMALVTIEVFADTRKNDKLSRSALWHLVWKTKSKKV